MGFFDRLAGKAPTPAPAAASGAPAAPEYAASPVSPKLVLAREKLDAKDLEGALAIYEEVLASSGDRADVLVTISGDLGSTGNIRPIIELVAPRYDALRHGPATGLNLLQAYLSAGEADSAQHVLDILFSLNRPELEDRLHGFSNAVAELLSEGTVQGAPVYDSHPEAQAPRQEAGLALVTISRPIWSYGLEQVPDLLPKKEGKLRRVAFTQLSLAGVYPDPAAAMKLPGDELARLSRSVPLWLSETFLFSPLYTSVAALSVMHDADGSKYPAVLPAEWSVENLRKLADSTEGGLDYIFTGALKREGEEFVLTLKVWEVKKFRERKQLSVRWTAATADAELAKLHEYLRAFMEWAPYPAGPGLPYAPSPSPSAWLEGTATLLDLFYVEKGLMPRGLLAPLPPVFDLFAPHAFSPPSASLTWISLRLRSQALGLSPTLAEVLLSSHPAVAKAKALLGA